MVLVDYAAIRKVAATLAAPIPEQEQVPCFIKRILGAMNPVLVDTFAIKEHIWFTTIVAEELLLFLMDSLALTVP